MSLYIGVAGAARALSKAYVGIDGTARQIQKVYVGVNGQARLVYQMGTPIGTLAVGSTVKIKVDGTAREFIVVQHGNPNTGTYDASCNGTWLLMKNTYTSMAWGSSNNSYESSSVHSYLNGTFYNLIDSDVRAFIKQVKIPYWRSEGVYGDLSTGSSGLSTKVFLLSGYEVGWTTSDNSYFPKDGVRLAYFGSSSAGNSKRKIGTNWWLRSIYRGVRNWVWHVTSTGEYEFDWYSYNTNIRPCIIVPLETLVDDDGNIMT